MNIRYLPGLVVLALLALAAPASAAFNSPMLLHDAPSADVLTAGSFAISADMSLPLTNTSKNVNYLEADANVRFSPFRGFEFGVTAYTLKDFVLDAKYKIINGGPGSVGLAVGIMDVGFNSYVSPIGHGFDDAWPDWKYMNYNTGERTRTFENFSAFVVTSIPLGSFARLHAGLGRGRFVGYDGPNAFLNTDFLFGDYHQWAVSLFGGAEVYVLPNVALVAEADSRDANAGIKADFGPISAMVGWNKVEGLVWAAKETPKFGRLMLGATYKLGPWTRQPAPTAPTRPVELPPAPEPKPEPPPIAEVLRLYPIWFAWDKSDITEVAASTLRRNAEVILAHPKIKLVIVSGYASEEGSVEHNLPLSERRALAAYEYLKTLGVAAERMTHRGLGESAGRPLPMHRSVYFEIEEEK